MKNLLIGLGAMFLILLTVTSVHELGHYLALRIFHVPVKEFSIGTGPLLYQKEGTTLFSLRSVLFIAYIDFDFDKSQEQLAAWKKVLIFFAGILNNWVLFLICIWFVSSKATMILAENQLFSACGTYLGIGPISFLLLIINIVRYGLAPTVLFLGIFSLFAGIINFLPIPGFDGGWILATIRGITEKKYEITANRSIKIIKRVSVLWTVGDAIVLLCKSLYL